ncbi:hypothetical protein TNIN_233261 [Trichonephila inaurata madagascariensis]|uniref:Uncharacterized protein n=1 Tax=Trichonephila inaurata madagascariensis TaxID=2747483 RepID=A0A8X6Y4N5_9ARAC|nr:hypothetical protein TNIN_233261 [Trichonephila inaurata madagascariensis]
MLIANGILVYDADELPSKINIDWQKLLILVQICRAISKEQIYIIRLAAEESDRKKKFSQVNIKKDVKNTESFKEVKQGSRIEVEYRSRSQSSKFIGQMIDINEFCPIKYLIKSSLGTTTFPAIDDEDRVEFNDVCHILLESNFDNPVNIISLIKEYVKKKNFSRLYL